MSASLPNGALCDQNFSTAPPATVAHVMNDMSRARFTEADVTRALKGAKKAGYSVNKARIIHGTGDIELVFGAPGDQTFDNGSDNEWDVAPDSKVMS
jgi:hypothetical protein